MSGEPVSGASAPVDPPGLGGSEPLAVAVVDDHAVVAEGLRALLEESGIAVAGTAPHAAAALELLERSRPQIVLVDYRLPDLDGLSLADEILRRWPDTKVVLMSAAASDDLLLAAVEHGCAGFVSKERSVEELVAAVRAAEHDKWLMPTDALSGLVERLGRPPRETAGGALSEREHEVLTLLAMGRSTAEIREQLQLSPHTVRNHVRAVLAKLGAHSQLEAVTIAVRSGLVSLEAAPSALAGGPHGTGATRPPGRR